MLDYNKINKCIRNALARIKPRRCQMGTYTYINYFCKRYGLSLEENLYIRKVIKKYIKRNGKSLFPVSFTINGKACWKEGKKNVIIRTV